MKIGKPFIPAAWVILFLMMAGCGLWENEPPTCEIVDPEDRAVITQGEQVLIVMNADDPDGSIKDVILYIDSEEMFTATKPPWEYLWSTLEYELGRHTLYAVATDDEYAESDSKSIAVFIDSPGGLNPDLTYGSVTDFDGNTYATIQIGGQTWMAENLKVTRYADGTAIPLVENPGAWGALSFDDRAYCWYDNSTTSRDIYGGLYTWAAAMNGAASSDEDPSGVQGVCPDGWHLPSDAEWKELEVYLGMSLTQAEDVEWRGLDEGGQLKEMGFSHWASPNAGATNQSGFTALPGGFRGFNGNFYDQYATFWTSTLEGGTGDGWYRSLYYEYMMIYRDYFNLNHGFSVRCIADD